MSRHVNIPIFIPHLGCPNQCVFCNQRTISGVEEFNPSDLKEIIEKSLSTIEPDAEVEIAFFGGSFTGIDRELMISLLDIAYSYVLSGKVSSIRCSTRPDYIDASILDILTARGVKVIELGLQSSSDSVLKKSKRGHDRACELRACKMIVERGITLIGQMMIGLPGSELAEELECARFIADVGASGARIYPTVVFRDTELCSMCESGEYQALTEEEAIERSAKVFESFIENNIDVIRIGLCASENLSDISKYFCGPNHPALGEMVINRYYLNKIMKNAEDLGLSDQHILKIKVSRGSLSKAIGQKKRNKHLLKRNLPVKDVVFVEDDLLCGYQVAVLGEVGEMKCI